MTMNEKRQIKYPNTDYFQFSNLNPKGNITGDCVIRAAAAVSSGGSWNDTYDALTELGKKTGRTPTDRKTYDKYLTTFGDCIRMKQPKHNNNTKVTCRELIDFYNELGMPNLKIFASVGAHHVTAILDTSFTDKPKYKVHDIWNCSNEKVGSYYIFFDYLNKPRESILEYKD